MIISTNKSAMVVLPAAGATLVSAVNNPFPTRGAVPFRMMGDVVQLHAVFDKPWKSGFHIYGGVSQVGSFATVEACRDAVSVAEHQLRLNPSSKCLIGLLAASGACLSAHGGQAARASDTRRDVMSFLPSPRLAVLEGASPPIDRDAILRRAALIADEFRLPAIPTNSALEAAYRNASGVELRASVDHPSVYVVVFKEGNDHQSYTGLVTAVVDAFTALGLRRCYDADVRDKPTCK